MKEIHWFDKLALFGIVGIFFFLSFASASIAAPSMTVSKTTAVRGEVINVNWSGFSGNVNVAVYKGGSFWVHALIDTAGSGSAALDTGALVNGSPWELRSDYRVKVELRSNPAVYVYSSYFSVSQDQAPFFNPTPSLAGSVSIPEKIYFSGTAQDDRGLKTVSMKVSGPKGNFTAFTDDSLNGLTSKELLSYWFDSDHPTYSGIAGTYTVELIITDLSDGTASKVFYVTVGAPTITLSKTTAVRGEVINVNWSGFSGNANVAAYKGGSFWVHALIDTAGSGSAALDTGALVNGSPWELRSDYRVKAELRSNPAVYVYSSYFSVSQETTSQRSADPCEKWRAWQDGPARVNTPELRDGLSTHSLSPAKIIYYAASENNINPVLLIAKLQDEQSLIEQGKDWGDFELRLLKATGLGAYDSGHTPKWYGFYPQLVGASYQFDLYRMQGLSFEQAYTTYTTGAGAYDRFVNDIYPRYANSMNSILGTNYSPKPVSNGYYNDFRTEVNIADIQKLLNDYYSSALGETDLFSQEPMVSSVVDYLNPSEMCPALSDDSGTTTIADYFEYPVGSYGNYGLCPSSKGDSSCYWLCQDFLKDVDSSCNLIDSATHLGEDWNRGSGSDDYGDPVYAVSHGDIVYADTANGWGKVLIIRHTLPNGTQVESLYGHLKDMPKRSGSVTRGEQIGTIGDGGGTTVSHLHFEVRHSNCSYWGSPGPGYSTNHIGWTDPSDFIDLHRTFSGPTSKFLARLNPDPHGDSNRIYWIQNNKRYHVISANILNAMQSAGMPGWSWSNIYTVSDSYTASPDFIGSGPGSEGLLIKTADAPEAHVIENGMRRWIPSETVFNEMGYNWDDIIVVSSAILNSVPEGDPLPEAEPGPYVTIFHSIQPGRPSSVDINGDGLAYLRVTLTNTGTSDALMNIGVDMANDSLDMVETPLGVGYDHIDHTFGPVTIPAGQTRHLDYAACYVGAETTDGHSIINRARIMWIDDWYNESTGEDYGGHGTTSDDVTLTLNNEPAPYVDISHTVQPGRSNFVDINGDRIAYLRITIANSGTADALMNVGVDMANGSLDMVESPLGVEYDDINHTFTQVTVPADQTRSLDYTVSYVGAETSDGCQVVNRARMMWIDGWYDESTGADFGGHGPITSDVALVLRNESDDCPDDPNKTSPGVCGCNVPDVDTDGDGTPDCNDQCADDPLKTEAGICGCGVADIDTDGDGTPDCMLDGLTPGTAFPLPLFDRQFNIEHTGSATWYSLNLTAGQAITVVLTAHLNRGGLDFALYDAASVELADSDDINITNGQTGIAERTVVAGGTYYIKVWEYSDAAGSYDLAVYNAWFNPGVVDSQRDYYHTFYTARYIQSGNYTASDLGAHMYRFTVQGNTQIDIALTAHLNRGGLDFALYDAQGVELADSNDINITDGQTGIASKFIIPAGIYYVKVWEDSDADGNYDLSISGASPNLDSDNDGLFDASDYYHGFSVDLTDTDGDGLADYEELLQGGKPWIADEYPSSVVAGALTPGTAFPIPFLDRQFNVEHTGSATWYSLNLTAGQAITVVLTAHLNRGGLDFALYDVAGVELADSNDINITDGQTGIAERTVVAGGTYYIKVWEYSDAVGSYDLAIYNAWFNPGVVDSQRDYYRTFYTACYIQSGNYSASDLGAHMYRFTVQGNTQVDIALTAHLNRGGLDFALYDAAGVELADSNDINITDGQTGIASKFIIPAGIYHVKVWKYSDADGNYDLSISGASPNLDSDSDGLFDASDYYHGFSVDLTDTDGDGLADYEELLQGGKPWIADEYPSSVVAGSLTPGTAFPVPFFDQWFNVEHTGSSTWYSLNLTAGQAITVVLTAHLNRGGLDFALYDSAGVELADSDDINITDGQTGIAERTVIAGGAYYIKVWEYSDAVGSYDLAVYNAWFNPGVVDSQRDYYCTFYTARYIQSGNYSASDLGAHMYRFTVQENTQVDIALTAHLNRGGIDFALYDAAGVELADSNDINITDGQTGTASKFIISTGVYYVKVWEYSDGEGNYDLSISGIAQVIDTDGDGIPNDQDGCPEDPNKRDPGLCGCGTLDTDTDSDGTPNCTDLDDDNDDMLDEWENTFGLNPLIDDSGEDFDGDDYTNLQEYLAGTAPNDPNLNPGVMDLNRGLVAYYPFNGNANDESGNGNHATELGGVTFADGLAGQAANFDGVDDGIEVNIGTFQNIAISLWFNIPSQENYYPRLFDYGDNVELTCHVLGPNPDYIENNITGKVVVVSCSTQNIYECKFVFSSTKPSENQWHHLYVVYDRINDTKKIYLDGVEEGEGSRSGDLNASSFKFGFGSTFDTPEDMTMLPRTFLKGLIDEARIYNRALSASEIQTIYNSNTSIDSDADGTPDDQDGCPNDPGKINIGLCGCGVADTDTDLDGDPNCTDADDDNDGMPDEWEIAHGLNPLINDGGEDLDHDGFTNLEEYEAASDPNDFESTPNRSPSIPTLFSPIDGAAVDPDNIVLRWLPSTDPDGDSIQYCIDVKDNSDNRAVFMGCTRPEWFTSETTYTLPILLESERSYGWRVTSRDENGNYGQPGEWWNFTTTVIDTDSDGLPDSLENSACTHSDDPDSDDDGLADGTEDANHNGVVDSGETNPCNSDTDGEGMPDGWEVSNGLNPNEYADASQDADGDGASNLQEYLDNTDPQDNTSFTRHPMVLLEDDFNDGVINNELWTASGDYVAESEGALVLFQNRTDAGGLIQSLPISVQPSGLITLEARLKTHRANDYFISASGIYDTSLNVGFAVGVHHYDIYDDIFGFGLSTSSAPYQRVYADTNGIWDEWFVEVITYDPETSMSSYSLNGSSPVYLTSPQLGDNQVVVFFNTYGWWTGHHTEIDYVKLTQQRASNNNASAANAGPDLTILDENQNSTTIQGTASDLDADSLTYRWLEGQTPLSDWQPVGPNGEARLDLSTVSPFAPGDHTLTLEASDGQATTTDSMILSVLDLRLGLYAHFAFEGNIDDSSTNDFQGASHGNIDYAPGIVGSHAAYFDGESYILFPQNYLYPLYNGTINMFVKIEQEADVATLIGVRNNYCTCIEYHPDVEPPSIGYCPSPILAGKWVMITNVYSNGQSPNGSIKKYVNGVFHSECFNYQNNARLTTGYCPNTTNTLSFIAGLDCSEYRYKGYLDDIRVYNRSLSDQEVLQLYKMANAVPMGDANGDGAVDLLDVILILKIASNLNSSSENIVLSADSNGDGRFGIEDALYCLQIISGMDPGPNP